ncbi:MAG: PAS domain-containing protein, partial [Anaerolineales bacterium]
MPPPKPRQSALRGRHNATDGSRSGWRFATLTRPRGWGWLERRCELKLVAMLSNLLDYIPDGVFTVDAEWRVTFFNRAAEQITGIKRAEAVGQFDLFGGM